MWRARRWRFLLNLIEHLPQNTHTMAAMLQDEEYARRAITAAKARGDTPSGPSLAHWSAESGILADIVDSLREGTAVAIAAAGGPAKPPTRYDRPRTAFDRVRVVMREEAHRKLVARVLPDQQ